MGLIEFLNMARRALSLLVSIDARLEAIQRELERERRDAVPK